MTSKIFRSILLAAAVVLLCSLTIVTGVAYRYFEGVQESVLRDELKLASGGVEQLGAAYLKQAACDRFRITWVDENGAVLYDSRADLGAMENHGSREEIVQALTRGEGSSFRYSSTLTEKTLYQTLRLADGTVLRLSVSQTSLLALLGGMLWPIGAVAVIAVCLSALLARRMARHIVHPLNNLNLEQPLENHRVYEEITPLLNRIDRQHRKISAQLRQLRQKNSEFSQITDNIKEGLVLLGKNRRILMINPAARQMFELWETSWEQELQRGDGELRKALEAAFDRGRSEVQDSRRGREYQFELNRIESEGMAAGAVILALDVTDRVSAEQSRREFSANVSHELKTPLQSIIGSAELLENGLVRPEDMGRFVGHIRKEACRLVNLVEDIIRLSQLDEGVDIPREEVDMAALTREVLAVLEPAAEQKGVSLRIRGDGCRVLGVRRLLYEIVYNLCDNGVKYNVSGGTVTVSLTRDQGRPLVSVADTGIGIPEEHQGRVFERFYRVDKSHSKQSGGTGLGLSIVKHAAAYHKAQLNLQSSAGTGTVISVRFP